MKNTKLTVLYRDADNYKAINQFILEGRMTEAQFNKLAGEGEDFVANELGLKNPALQFSGYDSFPNVETDHGVNTLEEVEMGFNHVKQHCFTDELPTTDMTVEQFVAAYVESAKDYDAEFQRLCEEAA
ncbi:MULTISPECIES: hypothetical protein [Vibrio]|uniref:hypothetical protein n=1 Tax=Vibrio TaxID=662 RepID=UPI001A1E25F2|nr:hypothetical protein [Vibrio penaeicida]HAS6097065.1 hypothetical protein [Vibrio vulnificus]